MLCADLAEPLSLSGWCPGSQALLGALAPGVFQEGGLCQPPRGVGLQVGALHLPPQKWFLESEGAQPPGPPPVTQPALGRSSQLRAREVLPPSPCSLQELLTLM